MVVMSNSMFGTAILMATLTAILLAVGLVLGGLAGMTVAFGLALLINGVSYWFSDTIVLKMYRAQPLKGEHLTQLVKRLCQDAKLPAPRLYLIKEKAPNAFATGRSPRHSAIAVTEGLLELEEEEIAGVLAHEIGHIANRDMLVSTMAATVAGAVAYAAQFGYYMSGSRDRQSIVPLILIVIFAPLAALLIRLAISRSREYGADRYGALLTRNPKGLATALKKISLVASHHPIRGPSATSHLWIANPFREDWFSGIFSTHPPISRRVQILEEMAKGKMK